MASSPQSKPDGYVILIASLWQRIAEQKEAFRALATIENADTNPSGPRATLEREVMLAIRMPDGAGRISEWFNVSRLESSMLVPLIKNLWLGIVSELLRTPTVRGWAFSLDTITALAREPLYELLYHRQNSVAWGHWGAYKKAYSRLFGSPDLQKSWLGRDWIYIERLEGKHACLVADDRSCCVMTRAMPLGEVEDLILRIASHWNARLRDGVRALYSGKVGALLDALRAMERRSRAGDLSADPGRHKSIRDFFLLVREYI